MFLSYFNILLSQIIFSLFIPLVILIVSIILMHKETSKFFKNRFGFRGELRIDQSDG